jgi:hypothetical protein
MATIKFAQDNEAALGWHDSLGMQLDPIDDMLDALGDVVKHSFAMIGQTINGVWHGGHGGRAGCWGCVRVVLLEAPRRATGASGACELAAPLRVGDDGVGLHRRRGMPLT